MRLDKALQSQGFGSRKECRASIEAGQVRVNGRVETDAERELSVDALELVVAGLKWRFRERVSLALHKPAGTECSHQPSHHTSVFSLLPTFLVNRGVQAVGRLDADTTGLLLMSDDGAFIQRLTSPKHHVPKEYLVTCAEPVGDELVAALREGVVLKDAPEPVRAIAAERVGPMTLSLELGEGKYHQVKRMIAAAGNHVTALHRRRIGAFVLPDELAPGAWMLLEDGQLERLGVR